MPTGIYERKIDKSSLIGKTIGEVIVLSFVRSSISYTSTGTPIYEKWWLCRCERCGTAWEVRKSVLLKGELKSCGCNREARKTHGMSKTTTYNSWCSMKRRCLSKESLDYKNYGGRGIGICGRWMKFENFLADMGKKPAGMSIERLNNDKGYSPDNCKWATRLEQNNNQRKNVPITFNGLTLNLSQWGRKIKIHPDTLWARLNDCKWSLEKSLTTPLSRYPKEYAIYK